MLKQYRGVFIIVGVAVAAAAWAVFVPTQRDMALMLAGMFALIAGISVFLTWSGAPRLVEGRERLLMIVGWSICAAAVVGGIGVLVLAGSAATALLEPVLFVTTLVALGGYMITRLPTMLSQLARSRAEIAAAKAPAGRRTEFDGIREGLAAPMAVLRGLPFLLQIAGPWIIVLAGGAFALLTWPQPAGHDPNGGLVRLLGLLLLLVGGLYVVLPSVLVAWVRWTVDGRTPKWIVATPDRASFGFAWRIWISLTFLGSLNRIITTPVTNFVSGAAPQFSDIAGTLVTWGVELLAVMLFSSVALLLPTIALGDKQFDLSAAAVRGRKMWPGLPLGLALSIIPIPLAAGAVSWVVTAGSKPTVPQMPSAHHALTPSDAVSLMVWLLVMLATLASGLSFVTRAYQAAKDKMV
jgi:hypothetical protein